jgi:hypothetical protein
MKWGGGGTTATPGQDRSIGTVTRLRDAEKHRGSILDSGKRFVSSPVPAQISPCRLGSGFGSDANRRLVPTAQAKNASYVFMAWGMSSDV